MSELYLVHHGILGQKWGVRRYQNKDGSLTAAGRKRLGQKNPESVSSEFRKQVRKERSKQSDWSNQWNINNTIGPNSKKAREEYDKARKLDEERPENKKIKAEYNKLNADFYEGKISSEEFEKKNEELTAKASELTDKTLLYMVSYTSKGREYVQEFLDTYGKNENIGYLKDLGYNQESAEYINSIIMKSNRKLLSGL